MIDILPLFKKMKDSGLPVESLVVGKEEDRSTWTIVFKKDVTEDQKKTAQTMMEAFDPNREEAKKNAINHVQAFMDAKAQEYGYDHILSASSYTTSTFPKFQAEGTAFAKWRDDVWLYCYSVLAEWEAGTSKITTEDELIASLPEFKVEY